MVGPYLESGESIIMTTDRVSVTTVMYDAILTTRRLLLIDNRHARIDPVVIPLSTIESVRSGKAATGEPVVLLATRERDITPLEQKVLLFLQEPLENRKPDRDLWVQKLIELSLSGRDAMRQDLPATRKTDEGVRPSTRRWVAPEIIRPRSEIRQKREEIPEIEIIPDSPEPQQQQPDLTPPASEPDAPGGPHRTGQEKPSSMDTVPHPTEKKGVGIPSPAPELTSPLTLSILAAAKSLTVRKDHEEGAGTAPLPAREVRKTTSLPEMPQPSLHGEASVSPVMNDMQDHPLTEEVVEYIRSTTQLPELMVESDVQTTEESIFLGDQKKEPEGIPHAPSTTESFHDEKTPAPATLIPAPPCTGPDEDREIPAGPSVTRAADREKPIEGASIATEVSSSTPLPKKTGKTHDGLTPLDLTKGSIRTGELPGSPLSGNTTLFIAGGFVLVVILIIAGIALLPGILQQDPEPVPQPPILTPAPNVTPVATPANIHASGVWIRIVSPGLFIGQAGNPGFLQQISGSGENYYKPVYSNEVVKVSVEKQEYTGDELRVELYKNGRLIASRSVTAPHGSVELLIDPDTEKPPGMVTPEA